MANLLSIVQDMTGELGLPQPSAVATASDPQTIQLFSLAKRELDELRRSHPWTFLQKLNVVTLSAVVTDSGTLTSGSTTISGLLAGTVTSLQTPAPSSWTVTDSGGVLPVSTRVVSAIGGGTTCVVDSPATSTPAATSSLTFSQDVYPLPSDFEWFQSATWWDRTNRWPLLGPDSPQIDQWHRSGIVVIGPRRHWRKVGETPNAWRIWPPLTSATTGQQEHVFEFITSNCVKVNNGATRASTFVNDADVPLLDSNAITLGLKWRWMQAKGYQYLAYQQEYIDYVDRQRARDAGNSILSLSPVMSPDYFLDSGNVPDGFYSGSNSVDGRT